MSVLAAEAVTVGYRDRPAPVLVAQSIALAAGRVTALIGPNGSGKSTLLKALARQLKPEAGRILLDGQEVAALPARTVAQRLGILFQENRAPAGWTVEGLVALGRHPHRGFLTAPTDADRAAVDRALARTGAEAFRRERLARLSGGQRQLAWLALALAQEPAVLLLDEPTTFLDLRHQIELMQVVRRLRDDGLAIALVLHDVNQAARHADELVALHEGRVVARGTPAEVVTPALLREVFGVDAAVVEVPGGGRQCWPTGLWP